MNYFIKPKSKYNNKVVDLISGERFDSKKEYARWCELKLMEQGGLIEKLERQVSFELIPAQYEDIEMMNKNGKKIIKKKLLERACSYLADFVYIDNENGKQVIEDTKSKATITPEYIIKRKLMLYKYGIKIKEMIE